MNTAIENCTITNDQAGKTVQHFQLLVNHKTTNETTVVGECKGQKEL